LDRQAPRRAVVRILETELDFLLHVASGAGTARSTAPAAACALAAGAAKKRLEEVRERLLLAEHLAHLVFGHRAEPAALRSASAAELTRVEPGTAGACLFVRPPVGAELVVLLSLGRVAEDLVRLVDFLEAGFRRFVPGIDVGVVLARQLAVRLLDFFVGRGLGDPERRKIGR